jgi:hypothetical protein
MLILHPPIYLFIYLFTSRPILLGKWPLGSTRRSWEDNVKLKLSKIGCEAGMWIEVAQDHIQWQV